MATADLLTMDSKKTAEKQKALDSALAQIERQFGWALISRLALAVCRWGVSLKFMARNPRVRQL